MNRVFISVTETVAIVTATGCDN